MPIRIMCFRSPGSVRNIKEDSLLHKASLNITDLSSCAEKVLRIYLSWRKPYGQLKTIRRKITMGISKQVTTLALLIICISCNQSKNDSTDSRQSTSNKLQPGVFYYSSNQVDSVLQVTVGDTSSIQSLGTGVILDRGPGDEPYYISKRTVDGYVEIHELHDDIVVIRSGHGRLRTGRKVNDSKLLNGEKPSRNWYGGQIIDFNEKRNAPGDFIVIPAMTGHQYIPDKNDTLIYWTIKMKRVE